MMCFKSKEIASAFTKSGRVVALLSSSCRMLKIAFKKHCHNITASNAEVTDLTCIHHKSANPTSPHRPEGIGRPQDLNRIFVTGPIGRCTRNVTLGSPRDGLFEDGFQVIVADEVLNHLCS